MSHAQSAQHSRPQARPPVPPVEQLRSMVEDIGRLHYGLSRSREFNCRPHILETWLVTLRDASVVCRVIDLLGGAQPGSDEDGQPLLVITDTSEVDVLLSGPEALDIGWHRTPGQVCDGTSRHDPRGSQPCVCPLDLADRQAATRTGGGCSPRVRLCFRLLQDPALGTLSFTSGNWAFAKQASGSLASLRSTPRPTAARLSLHRTPYRLRSGTTIIYTRPALALTRAGSFDLTAAVPPREAEC
jgi:hypothetical protein